MGVNHEGTNPPEFAVGDANTGCPPRFLSYFKISSARHGFVPPPQISTQIYATGDREGEEGMELGARVIQYERKDEGNGSRKEGRRR
jgi:hypothetical protein